MALRGLTIGSLTLFKHSSLRGRYRQKIYIFFIIYFNAVMHRTIIQNKILSICSCLFFCLPNIYRPSLGKVQLGRPNQKTIQPLNFYLRKKNILLRIVWTTMYHHPIFKFEFHLFKKKHFKKCIKKSVKMLNYIYIFFF